MTRSTGRDEGRIGKVAPVQAGRGITEVICEIRFRQAHHDERSAARRYAFGLPAPSRGRSTLRLLDPGACHPSLGASLVEVADVVLRLQDTVDVQGELLGRVIEHVLPGLRPVLGDRHFGSSTGKAAWYDQDGGLVSDLVSGEHG